MLSGIGKSQSGDRSTRGIGMTSLATWKTDGSTKASTKATNPPVTNPRTVRSARSCGVVDEVA
jgi:hypothetical protein